MKHLNWGGKISRPTISKMKRFFLLTILISGSLFAQLRMKRVTLLNSGPLYETEGLIVCADCNRNGANELIFQTLLPNDYICWQIWEFRPMNKYELVYADTGWSIHGTPPVGIKTGNLYPFGGGYLDSDSCYDLVGENKVKFPPESLPSVRPLTTVQEGQSPSSYPNSLVWFDLLPGDFFVFPHYITDLDQDNNKEILFRWYYETSDQGTRIYENTGNNQYQLVFNEPPVSWNTYAFGDFDQDGRTEIAFPVSLSKIYIRKCIGNNQYPVVCSLPYPSGLTNPHDCWDGRDVDQDGKPEFFIAFCNAMTSTFYLYMWEAITSNTYEMTFIAQKQDYVSYSTGRRSKCGDIDGDGIEEIIWATPVKLYVYKATGNNQFQQVWEWSQDHGTDEALLVNIYDMNNDGYNEIVVGGSGKTSVFEVEAVRVLSPNGGEIFQGDSQQLIRWQTFNPPRCDSLSLFYSIDNGRIYTTIVTGVPGTETSYVWTVPNTNSDSCKIKIIAYGPGWQYDESDGLFSIISTGIEESTTLNALRLTLKVTPNIVKSFSVIHYTLPSEGKIALQLYDISGRIVKTLVNETKEPGIYKINLNTKNLSSGIYFLFLQTEEKRIIERFVNVK